MGINWYASDIKNHIFFSKPAIDINTAYSERIGTSGIEYTAVDISTGEQKWVTKIRSNKHGDSCHGMVVAEKRLLGAINNMVFALDTVDGAKLWTQYMRGFTRSLAAGMGKVFLIFVDIDDKAIKLVAVDAQTGDPAWTYVAKVEHEVCVGPSLAEDCVYFSGDRCLYAVSAISGELLWDYWLPSLPIHAPVIADGHVLVCCEDGYIYAVREAT